MLALARNSAARAGAANATFLHGHIEDIPLPDGHVDVVISNCVISLSTDKATVLAEAFRVLRPGGRLGVSDVIADDGLDTRQRAHAEQRVGCVSGTLNRRQYQDLLATTGFTAITITATTGPATACTPRPSKPASPEGRTSASPVSAAAALARQRILSTWCTGTWCRRGPTCPQ